MHKRTLFFFLFLLCIGKIYTQPFIENFANVDSLFLNGWVRQNNSSPAGSGEWVQDFGNFTAPFAPNNSSIVVGYQSIATGQAGDISNWLITPTLQLTAGDSIVFYTISYQNTTYPDRMEVRLNRSNTINVGTTTASVGDFDTVLFTINPNLVTGTGGYPMIWTRYACKIEGIAPATPCRVGLRYFVTNGGQAGTNGSTIGVDHFQYKQTLVGVEEAAPLLAFVQLINGQITIDIPEATHAFTVELMDVSGKTIHAGEYQKTTTIGVENYSAGVYLIKIVYEGKYLVKKISF